MAERWLEATKSLMTNHQGCKARLYVSWPKEALPKGGQRAHHPERDLEGVLCGNKVVVGPLEISAVHHKKVRLRLFIDS